MDSYHSAMSDSLRPLDFTSAVRHTIKQEDDYEAPVLDLSCKSQPQTTSTVQYEPHLNSPSNSDKNPFEGRSFMVTPPSESDSPKKTKYEPIRNYLNMTPHGGCLSTSMVPIPANLPIPITIAPIVQPLTPPALISSMLPTSSSQSFKSDDESSSKESAGADSMKKAPRPFKAYPKDPLSLAMGPTEMIYDQNSNEAYSEFRKRMLESVRKTNEGTNVKMRRVSKSPGLQGSQPTSTQDDKDAAYWERRRKNNEAAKRSRDARRAKEDEIAIRAAFLEQENMKLKYELVALRNETAKLRCMVYST